MDELINLSFIWLIFFLTGKNNNTIISVSQFELLFFVMNHYFIKFDLL